MTCDCQAAGYCETYKREMGPRLHSICRGEVLAPEKCEAYRVNWRKLAAGEIVIDERRATSPPIPPPHAGLTGAEVAELFPGQDPTLLGNRIKALTAAIGIPTCGGCEVRAKWLNKAHEWLRRQFHHAAANSSPETSSTGGNLS